MTSGRGALALRQARPEEAGALSALCLRAKAIWGYDAAFMRACEAELAVTAAAIAAGRVQVAERDGRVVGMAQIAPDGPAAELDKLFVEPDAMGGGAGRALFDWAVTAARHAGARTMTIDADPGAAAFYRRMGAMDDGMVPSGSIAGRMLPRLRMDM